MTVLVREPEVEISNDLANFLRSRLLVPFGIINELNRLVDDIPFIKQFYKTRYGDVAAAVPICCDGIPNIFWGLYT